jgi:hypothetical protein
MRTRLLYAVPAALLVLSACSHQSVPRTAAEPLETPTKPSTSSTAASAAGAVSFDVIVDPNAPKPRLGEHEELIQPELRYAPLPEFPAAALAAGAGPAAIGVRVTIGEGGTVTDVRDSPLAGSVSDIRDSPLVASYSGPFAAEFREAVYRAVRRWITTQARIDTVRNAPPNQGYDTATILVKWRPVPVYVDLTFRFAIVDGKGGVELAPKK